jgi:DNA-binding MarR family transcriptional regulator
MDQTMNGWKLKSWVCTALMRLGTRMATGFDRHFADLGLTQAQFRVLLEIWEHGSPAGMAPSTLADHLFIERATVSVLTNRMVQLGWLVRTPGENRRTYNLALTEAGEQLLAEAVPRAKTLADDTLSKISQEQLQDMRALLSLIESRLRDEVPPAT